MPVVKTKYFEAAFSSVLQQSYGDFEIIVLDNGADVALDWTAECERRVKHFKNPERLPMVENWNKALGFASGDYVLLMSDDDIMEPDYLKEVDAVCLAGSDVKLVHVRTRIIDENGTYICETAALPAWESFTEFIDMRMLKHRHQYISDFVFHRNTLIANGGFFSCTAGWDADVQTSFLAAMDGGCHNINKLLFNYRINRYNVSSVKGDFGRLKGALEARTHFFIKIAHSPAATSWGVIKKIRYANYYRRLIIGELADLYRIRHINGRQCFALVYVTDGFMALFYLVYSLFKLKIKDVLRSPHKG